MTITHNNRWLWLVALFLIGWLIYQLSPILSPFLVGILLAYLGDPLVDRLERWKLSRTWGVILVFSLFTLLCLLLLLVLVPMLGKQLMHLYELAPLGLDWLQLTALPWVQARFGLDDDFWRVDQLKSAFSANLGSTKDVVAIILSQATASSIALLAWLANLLLVPVVCFYLLRDWDLIMAKLRTLLPRRREDTVMALMRECHEVIGAFLRGQLLVMLALAVVYSAGLMLVGVELGLLIGVLAGLASIVPYMGFVVGIGAAVIAVLFQFGLELYPLLGVAAVFTVGQMMEGMLLTPLLVGDRIGLHPVAVIFAVLAGGQLFGFTGVLLALPVAAVIMVLLRHVHDLYKLSDLYAEPPADPPRQP
ncbi:AI-2E family transporter [Pseudomonas sp. Choline-3u-10]|jgi:predicted PurR-regulated permease PerM|uniref:AI-2E family transporter n=1 Tax=Pseudomonadaceae TaxID=135621 RepID=UPI000617AA68|nr:MULTISPECIES: AI-2E family transporter [Pseudomonadaceae]AZZ44765.1 AI-2E family transporter [Pseudomonadaceae bacterium SI-3]MAL36194.1 AI-2E family transporter [Pseudomonas sp.]MBU0948841.1 AI-2E family transporter [Gammaproteobacteria bacterium]KJJ64147.1 membrane protein [Pseudomonas sp. 10B238]MBK3796741.1 AI-2E family transporter [Stutzerimonas stutzeri]|tara:strand:- start:9918 stop:11006 length:1089 start_codon:yes stop_codon:yes gene_type:complete